ncbi:hypothetical protein PHOSAC3_90441 [Mesotoga infera]|nr:hypothetical protein PHOSAC3_90441 [Mesotoga infera]
MKAVFRHARVKWLILLVSSGKNINRYGSEEKFNTEHFKRYHAVTPIEWSLHA